MTPTTSMTPAEAEAYRKGLAEGGHLGWAVGNAAGMRTGFEQARERAAAECADRAVTWEAALLPQRRLAALFCKDAIRAMEPPA